MISDSPLESAHPASLSRTLCLSTSAAAGMIAPRVWNHAAHGRTDAPMHVRHRRHPLVDEWQLRDVKSCWRAASSSGTPLVQALMGTPLSGLITL
jgi:hypothetical protein